MAVSMGKSCVVVAAVLVMISSWPLARAEGLQYDQYHLNLHDQNSSSCTSKSPARPVNVQPRDSNFLYRTLGRCLLQSSSDGPAAAQAPDTMLPTLPTDPDASSLLAPPPDPGQVAAGDPPSTSLPTLPTDPDPAPASSISSPPSPADPSSTATSNSSPPSPVIVGDPNSGSASTGSAQSAAPSTSSSSSSSIGAKIGLGAGVGITGVIMVIVGLLYYFKPDVFMCCRTCVRVQISHHNPHAVGKISHSTV